MDNLSRVITCCSVILAGLFCASNVSADGEVDAFIETVKTVTYDCPNTEYLPQVESYLADNRLTPSQRFALSVEKSHFLLCSGKANQAHDLLFAITDSANIEKESYYYASAIYQIGFAYDVKEKPERCEYYQSAKELADNRHPDVFLSASLSFIAECMNDHSAAQRLNEMFGILQRYSQTQDYAALAHIHNNIGLTYADLEQFSLAAEQYLKAHEMGLEVYTGSNLLSILPNAITALLSSGEFELAYENILEFEKINKQVNTSLTNFYQHYLLVNYHYHTDNIEAMRAALPALQEKSKLMGNAFFESLVDWFSVVPCVEEQNISCIETYIEKTGINQGNVPKRLANNMRFQQLRVEMLLALNNIDMAQKAFSEYAALMNKRRFNSQNSARIMSVADLYNKIYTLENEVKQANKTKQMTLLYVVLFFVSLILLSVYFLRKRHLTQMSIDPETKLLNARTAISRIAKIGTPDIGKSNAIALFDLANFREVNRAIGATKDHSLISKIAAKLNNLVRGADILGRFAPEQIIICLPNVEERDAKAYFDRLQNELENSFKVTTEKGDLSLQTRSSIYFSSEKITDINNVLEEILLAISLETK